MSMIRLHFLCNIINSNKCIRSHQFMEREEKLKNKVSINNNYVMIQHHTK